MERHNHRRALVCTLCCGPGGRPISPALLDLVRRVIPDFNADDHRFPSTVCDRCRKQLYDPNAQIKPFDFKSKMDGFVDPGSNVCSCFICGLGQKKSVKAKPSRGRPPMPPISRNDIIKESIRPVLKDIMASLVGRFMEDGGDVQVESIKDVVIDVINDLFTDFFKDGDSNKVPKVDGGGESIRSSCASCHDEKSLDAVPHSMVPASFLSSSHCQGHHGRGYACCRSSRVDKLMIQNSPGTLKRLATECLKEDLMAGPVDLPTSGRPLKIARVADKRSAIDERQPMFSYADIDVIQVGLGLSTKQTRDLCTWLRSVAGNDAIQPRVDAHLVSQNSFLAPFFAKTTFEGKPVTYCSDVRGMIAMVSDLRGGRPKLMKIGIDGGRNILKFTLTLVCGASEPSHFLETSVKRIILIGAAVGVAESYESLSFLWMKLRLNELEDFVISGDYKVLNLLLGLSTHASMFSCCYCVSFSKRTPWAEANLKMRSFEDIRKSCAAWKESGGNEKDRMNFFSTREMPLPNFSGLVIDHVSPPHRPHCI